MMQVKSMKLNNLNARREKSLSLLCQKFLSFYPKHVNQNERIIISLDTMAQILEVERRRIYDIVNVLESVEILSRFCKNQYIWHGFSQVPYTLSKLKTLSVKSNFLEYTKALMASQLEQIDLHQDSKQAVNVYFELSHKSNSNGDERTKVINDSKDASTQTISISREEKSLGIMSQKFLMLFLTSENGLVSINFAARVLLGDTKNDVTELGRFKTKIRRLYDIANVLTSIGLIKKYHYNDTNISKPAYKYIGPNVDIIRNAEYVFDFMNCGNPSSNSKHSLFDHFKRNLDLECNIPKFDVNTGILRSKIKIEIDETDNNISQQSKSSKQKSLIKIVEKQEVHSPPPQMIQPAQIQPSYFQLIDVQHQSPYYHCSCGQELQQNEYQNCFNYSSYAPILNDPNYSESSTNINVPAMNPITNGNYFPFSHYYQSESGSSLNSNSSNAFYQSANMVTGGAATATLASLPSFNTFLN